MKSLFKKSLSTCVLCSLIFALFACGKKADNSGGPAKTVDPLEPDDFETYLSNQSITCADNSSCPTYIAKVVVRQGPGNYKTCTGFLTDSNTVATSTTCLSKLLRLTGQDCSQDVYFFFTKPFAKALRVGCKTVEQASENYGSDPVFNRDDVAFLRMDTSLPFRRNLSISRDGIPNNKTMTFMGVEQTDSQNGEIKEIPCMTAQNSYVNPLVSSDDSPGVNLAGCKFTDSFTGAPIIDYKNKNRVRGILTQAMNPAIRKYLEDTKLLVNGLKDFIHGTNFACAPTIYDSNVADEKECGKDLTQLQLNKLRGNMLATSTLFAEFKTRLETALEATKYIRFAVTMTPQQVPGDPSRLNYDVQDVTVEPKCFKDVNTMSNDKVITIKNFRLPKRTFKKIMDDVGRPQSVEIDNGSDSFYINFSPKEVKKYGTTPIYYWNGQTGETLKTITDKPICQ